MEPVLRKRALKGIFSVLGVVHVFILVQLWSKKEVHYFERASDEMEHFAQQPWKLSRGLSVDKDSDNIDQSQIHLEALNTKFTKDDSTTATRTGTNRQSSETVNEKQIKKSLSSRMNKDPSGNSLKREETEPPLDDSPETENDKEAGMVEDHRAFNATLILDQLHQKLGKKKESNFSSLNEISRDDPSILQLQEQGIRFNDTNWQEIPPWSKITSIYGEEPVILGLETCEEYRQKVPRKRRYVAPAGNFNTGTNLFSYFFGKNCQGLAEKQLVQVPWGKHNMAWARLDNYRVNNTRYKYEGIPSGSVLPVVMVRHPVSWMFSTCRHSYAAYWNHTEDNCPHLVNDDPRDARKLVNVHVGYGYKKVQGKKYHRHQSLVHFWKDWYQSYADNLPFPRIIVRLEDIVYQPGKVLSKLCECAGGTQRNDKVLVPEESVKVKRDRLRNKTGLPGSLVRGKETAGLVKAWIDHSNISGLWDRIPSADRKIIRKVLSENEGLLQLFHYKLEGI